MDPGAGPVRCPASVFYGGTVRRVMVVGGSGHARCVVDAAQAGSTLEVVAIVDDGAAGPAGGASGGAVLGVPIVGGTDLVAAHALLGAQANLDHDATMAAGRAWVRVRSPAARSASAGRLRWRWGRSFVMG